MTIGQLFLLGTSMLAFCVDVPAGAHLLNRGLSRGC